MPIPAPPTPDASDPAPPGPPAACCGGPPKTAAACCALDERRKAEGEAGCGCGDAADRHAAPGACCP